MPDRITQLERLNRLRAEGGLSDEEFEREKQRLLEPRLPRAWILAGLAFFVASGIGLAFLLSRADPVQAPQAQAKSDRVTIPRSPPGRAAPPAPQLRDISSRISISGGECRFSSDLQRALDRMFVRPNDGEPVRASAIRLADMRLVPTITSERDEGVLIPYRRYTSRARLSTPAQWNGLRLIGLETVDGWEFSSQALEFSDDPARVRAALLRMGIRVPAPPASRTLPTDGCAAAIGVTASSRGSALVCDSWC
jgi:hypothetical protein